jgi:O-methyltransferase involved in polyketide biosynthesis
MSMADGDFSSRPSSARIYDALLGGNHNFAADREAAEKLLEAIPYAAELARANRAFLNRAVTHMLDAGVRQFLDLGSGIPTVGNVHEIAQSREQSARVVYVDIDPVAVATSGEILKDNPNAIAVQADMRFPEAILADPALLSLLDLGRPIGLLLVSVLHFLPDQDAFAAVAGIRDALPPGSFVALSHGVVDTPADEAAEDIASIYRRTDVTTAAGRTRPEIMRFFGPATLVPPGLVWVHQWPDGAPEVQNTAVVAAVGRLP